ncbi:dihydrodipicolinate synthase family protein [Agromyces silvae]|uniref:dihydrodipicolinate synthase family protein n=1 Tax=Agromyces silvae TaxID=3388266 RepID=UPI00280B6C18|nr:dihydrodipicolinate synthase family protein [Agromyces protaetiae]
MLETSPVVQADARARLWEGGVIPAQPLALTRDRTFDERRQRAILRYHVESGSLGIATAVHSTQFSVHDEHRAYLAPLLELAAETVAEYPNQKPLLVAGVTGMVPKARQTAELAAGLGYDFVLLSGYGCDDLDERQLLDRAAAVSEVLPVIGFYLQPAVGGRVLSTDYWRRMAELPNVVGIKVAPFDRYGTLDVMQGLALSERADQVALYTGNDDNIVFDLVSRFPALNARGDRVDLTFRGGLLGQWAVWTKTAVETLEVTRRARNGDVEATREALRISQALTDANGAIFDAKNGFKGVIPGIHEVLRRHGLLEGIWLLDETETLSPGQLREIDRVWDAYPELRDDAFIAEHLDRWLR